MTGAIVNPKVATIERVSEFNEDQLQTQGSFEKSISIGSEDIEKVKQKFKKKGKKTGNETKREIKDEDCDEQQGEPQKDPSKVKSKFSKDGYPNNGENGKYDGFKDIDYIDDDCEDEGDETKKEKGDDSSNKKEKLNKLKEKKKKIMEKKKKLKEKKKAMKEKKKEKKEKKLKKIKEKLGKLDEGSLDKGNDKTGSQNEMKKSVQLQSSGMVPLYENFMVSDDENELKTVSKRGESGGYDGFKDDDFIDKDESGSDGNNKGDNNEKLNKLKEKKKELKEKKKEMLEKKKQKLEKKKQKKKEKMEEKKQMLGKLKGMFDKLEEGDNEMKTKSFHSDYVEVKNSELNVLYDFAKKGEDNELVSMVKRDLVDDLLLKVFNLLKDSGLINEIIRMSLTDPLVRRSLTDVTARLLKARVVPWDDIFIALRRHGLAFEVVEFTLTNAETRAGLASFVVELLPRLVNAGSITPGQLLDTIPRIQEEVDSRKSQKGSTYSDNIDSDKTGGTTDGAKDFSGPVKQKPHEVVVPDKIKGPNLTPIPLEIPKEKDYYSEGEGEDEDKCDELNKVQEKPSTTPYEGKQRVDEGKLQVVPNTGNMPYGKPMYIPFARLNQTTSVIPVPNNQDQFLRERAKNNERYGQIKESLPSHPNNGLLDEHSRFNNPEKLKNLRPLFPSGNSTNGSDEVKTPYPRIRVFYDGTFIPNYPVDFKPPIAGGSPPVSSEEDTKIPVGINPPYITNGTITN